MGSSSLSVEAAPLFLLPQFHLLFTLADTHSAPAAQPAHDRNPDSQSELLANVKRRSSSTLAAVIKPFNMA